MGTFGPVGMHEALPKHSIWFDPDPEPIRVQVLDPVDTGPYAEDEARALQRHVRAKIIQQIADWRGTDSMRLTAEAAPKRLPCGGSTDELL